MSHLRMDYGEPFNCPVCQRRRRMTFSPHLERDGEHICTLTCRCGSKGHLSLERLPEHDSIGELERRVIENHFSAELDQALAAARLANRRLMAAIFCGKSSAAEQSCGGDIDVAIQNAERSASRLELMRLPPFRKVAAS